MTAKGYFITLEGGEGSGKTTQIRLLAEAFRKAGLKAETTRAPGGTEVAEKLRTILKVREPGEDLLPETELLLFAASHSQMTHYLLRPRLADGISVICDRFFDSTIVYQGFARGLPVDKVRDICRFSCRGFRPDLTLLLDLPPETGLARTRVRTTDAPAEGDRFDSETLEFHKSVRSGFLTLAAMEPERFAVIPADGSAEETAKAIRKAIHEKLHLELL